MDTNIFNQILKNSSLKNMVVSSSTGTKNFVSQDQDNNFIQSSPSLDDLKKKFISESNQDAATEKITINLDSAEDDDVDMKIIKEESGNEADNKLNERTVIASVKEGVIGSRG